MALLIDGLERREVPTVYINGFELGLSNADIAATLLLAGNPVQQLHMSFTTAKTLTHALNQLMATLESVTGREIMTTHEVGEGLSKLDGAQNDI